MKDQFEKYLEENRRELDSRQLHEPIIWSGIERNLRQKKNNRNIILWRAAAIVLAFMTVVQFTYILTNKHNQQKSGELAMISPANGAFETLEASYRQEMYMLEQRIAEKKVDPEDYSLFYEEMSFINQVENEFKEEIPLTNDREKLAAILIDTYEKKIQLLERLLQQVERDEKREKHRSEGLTPLKNTHKTLTI